MCNDTHNVWNDVLKGIVWFRVDTFLHYWFLLFAVPEEFWVVCELLGASVTVEILRATKYGATLGQFWAVKKRGGEWCRGVSTPLIGWCGSLLPPHWLAPVVWLLYCCGCETGHRLRRFSFHRLIPYHSWLTFFVCFMFNSFDVIVESVTSLWALYVSLSDRLCNTNVSLLTLRGYCFVWTYRVVRT